MPAVHGAHPHRDMEIISYVLDGGLAHKDSMGTGAVIKPGEVQRMSAGTGVVHSELNASKTDEVHFLQIWLIPRTNGIEPGYEQKAFSAAEQRGALRLVASPDGRDGSVSIHTDANVYAGTFDAGQTADLPIGAKRGAWVQVARGDVRVNGVELAAGDGLAVEGERAVTVGARPAARSSCSTSPERANARRNSRADIQMFQIRAARLARGTTC